MKAFKLKPLVAALVAAGVCRAHAAALVPPRLLPIAPAVNHWNFSDDMPVWAHGYELQLVSCVDAPGNGRPTLRLIGKNTAEVLDFSMFLSPNVNHGPRLVVDSCDVGRVECVRFELKPEAYLYGGWQQSGRVL
jgi:hypothetical protein